MKIKEVGDADLLKMFIALRDRRAQRKAEFAAADESDKNKQERIEAEFLSRFQDRGIDNVSTRGIGTAYMTTRSSCSTADWDIFLKFVMEQGAWEMLEHRPNKTAVAQFVEEHGDLPPGVNWSETQVVNVRRK